jgi:hypothetical protein
MSDIPTSDTDLSSSLVQINQFEELPPGLSI